MAESAEVSDKPQPARLKGVGDCWQLSFYCSFEQVEHAYTLVPGFLHNASAICGQLLQGR